jgi:hypothetical protein
VLTRTDGQPVGWIDIDPWRLNRAGARKMAEQASGVAAAREGKRAGAREDAVLRRFPNRRRCPSKGRCAILGTALPQSGKPQGLDRK